MESDIQIKNSMFSEFVTGRTNNFHKNSNFSNFLKPFNEKNARKKFRMKFLRKKSNILKILKDERDKKIKIIEKNSLSLNNITKEVDHEIEKIENFKNKEKIIEVIESNNSDSGSKVFEDIEECTGNKELNNTSLTLKEICQEIQKIIHLKYENEKLEIEKQNFGKKYSLVDDIKLFLIVIQHDNYNGNTINKILENKLGFFNYKRSIESLRDRCKRFLLKMNVTDWLFVLDHIKTNGFKGCLKFVGERNNKLFLGIEVGKTSFNIHSYEKKTNDNLIEIESEEEIQISAINKQIQQELSENTKEKEIETTNENHQTEFLSQTINYLATLLNKDEKFLIQILDEVSGDVNDLVEVLKKNKDYLRWSKEDDIALENSLSFENLAFQMLLRYKGLEKIKRRLEYKNKKLNFNL